MRIDELKTMVVIHLRYLFSVKRDWQKTVVYQHIPAQRIFAILITQYPPPLNISLGERKLGGGYQPQGCILGH